MSRQDHDAIEAVVLDFFRLVDMGRADETLALFTPDATVTFAPGSPKPGTIAGPDIAAAMTARAAQKEVTTRHVVTNFHIERRSEGRTICSSLLTLYRTDAGRSKAFPPTIADVEDVMEQSDGRWRIAARTITPIFVG
ncbi:nuclear transport factor 2 family protein [Sphingomonas profundi]|uniref:nuclear transport factor 2 family protein n=1 Tax=Alterirhizorhabdus profundi TaxID=2681549 RepID=UPI0018D01FDD|nr:nuclear transport factor 2 family protein [Sphingomonas profundi]